MKINSTTFCAHCRQEFDPPPSKKIGVALCFAPARAPNADVAAPFRATPSAASRTQGSDKEASFEAPGHSPTPTQPRTHPESGPDKGATNQ